MKYSEISKWMKIFFPLLLALSFSRFLLQTDLYFLSSFPDAVILLAFLSQVSVIDSVLAFAVIPVVLIVVSKYKSHRMRNAMVSLSFLLGILISILSFVLSIFLVYVLEMQNKLEIPKTIFGEIILISSLTIPFRWLQLSTTSLLHMEKKGSYVMLVSFLSVFGNIFLNYVFMSLLGLGYKGCWISTLFISILTSLLLAYKLKVTFSKNLFFERIVFLKAKMKIFHEGLRVLLQKSGFAMLSALLLSASIEKIITVQFSILLELGNLFSILSVVIYRTTIIFNDTRNKNFVKNYFSFGFIFNFFIGILVFFLSSNITLFYQLKENQVLLFYLKTVVVAILLNSLSSFIRAKIQLQNKFLEPTIIESSVLYLVFIPFTYFMMSQKMYLGVVVGFLLNSLLVTYVYYFRWRRLQN